jgi:hypothetical protein
MPKKPKLTEPEIHAMILKDVKIRLGCQDFEPVFTLHRIEDDPRTFPHSNWKVFSVEKADTWKPDCAQAFDEAVARARRKFDIEWRA